MNNDRLKALVLQVLVNKSGEENICYCLAEIADLSNVSEQSDFKNVNLNATTLFVEKSMALIKEEKYDEWLEYYKEKLIVNEDYELVSFLGL